MITTHPRVYRLLLILLILLALACAWLFPLPLRAFSDPRLTARWDTATSATVQWTQTARGCLSVRHATGERVFLLCSERYPATIRVELGHTSTDGTARPASGDTYWLVTGGQAYSASLLGRAQYLAIVRR